LLSFPAWRAGFLLAFCAFRALAAAHRIAYAECVPIALAERQRFAERQPGGNRDARFD